MTTLALLDWEDSEGSRFMFAATAKCNSRPRVQLKSAQGSPDRAPVPAPEHPDSPAVQPAL